jgi:hypothetical protein
MFVLPHDFLKHVGYGPETIKPYVAIDNKVEFTRTQSTLRGPNPLGAYLVIVITALTALFVARKKQYAKIVLLLVASLAVLYGSYSRSAWIGAAAAIAVLWWGFTRSPKMRQFYVAAAVVAITLVIGLVFIFRDHDTVQNVVFHTNEQSRSATSSNEQRADALTGGVKDVLSNPFGQGPGTAGPASFHNDSPAKLSENYFIQIGQEVGILGTIVFIVICVVIASALWQQSRDSVLAFALFAGLIGLTAVNLVSHAWADDTLAYTWWGLAGLTFGSIVAQGKTHGIQKTK